MDSMANKMQKFEIHLLIYHRRWFESQQEKAIFLFFQVDHSSPTCDKVKNARSYNCSPPYVFMVWMVKTLLLTFTLCHRIS
jgi:hypothetical protein